MRVTPIAQTVFMPEKAFEATDWTNNTEPVGYADATAEFAGRNCYQSWDRPNPKTATNEGYLKNILDQGHFSVLEHSSISFYVEGVSRALLTELERHRFLSFSVISQRYVWMNYGDAVVVPPAIRDNGDVVVVEADEEYPVPSTVRDEFDGAMVCAFNYYELMADALIEAGLPKKKALEAARSVLPNATEVKMVVTGNIRAWRDVIGKRYHEAADAEIREFATEVLRHLREYAPNSVQDIPEVPYA